MSGEAAVDYDSLASKYGGQPDLDAIASKYGGSAGGDATTADSGPAPITAPKASDFVPDSQTLPNLAKGAATGVENMGKGLVNTVLHPIDTLKGAAKTVGDTYHLAKEGQYVPAAATALGLAGFDEPHLAQLWNEGKGSQAVGEATPMAIADAVAAEKTAGRGDIEVNGKPVMQSARETAQKGVYDAEGKMRPLAKTGARIAGAGVGSLTPIPGAGVVGAIAGPEALRGMVPPPEIPEVPEPEPAIIKGPSQSIRESPNFDPEAYKAGRASRIAPPEAEGQIAAPYGRGGESQIGSNAVERQVQTIVQKNVVTPDEQSFVERNLGPNARMRPGEGITDWRARVTGLMKAARARTK